MGNVRLGIPEQLAFNLAKQGGCKTFLETGTYKGATAVWAANSGAFERVYTMEAYKPRFIKTASALSGRHNIQFINEDSRNLGLIINDIQEPILFWLDAHWCGSHAESMVNGDECPLREELLSIANHPLAQSHVILIDDARLFLSPPPLPHNPAQWPSFSEIIDLLPGNTITGIYEDVIVTVPVGLREIVNDYQRLNSTA